MIGLFETIVRNVDDAARLSRWSDSLARMNIAVGDQLRRVLARSSAALPIPSGGAKPALGTAVLDCAPPWSSVEPPPCEIPGMISREERQYYVYLPRFYGGHGEVVELGSWLGCSTFHILAGLGQNKLFRRRLQVFDDFVWRSSWMDDKVPESLRPANHEDFSNLFMKNMAAQRERLAVERSRICVYDGNEGVAPLRWGGQPVEMMFIDCGRTFEVNEAWYRIFSPCFIPDRTLLVMQDWRMHREVPVQWYNQTKQFTDSKGSALQLIHELRDGGVATFLYRG